MFLIMKPYSANEIAGALDGTTDRLNGLSRYSVMSPGGDRKSPPSAITNKWLTPLINQKPQETKPHEPE